MSKNEKRDIRLAVNLTQAEYIKLWNSYVNVRAYMGIGYKWSDFIRDRLFPKTDNTTEDK